MAESPLFASEEERELLAKLARLARVEPGRIARAYEALSRVSEVSEIDGEYVVAFRSRNGKTEYSATLSKRGVSCTCPDFAFRGELCKHVVSALLLLKRRGVRVEDIPLRPLPPRLRPGLESRVEEFLRRVGEALSANYGVERAELARARGLLLRKGDRIVGGVYLEPHNWGGDYVRCYVVYYTRKWRRPDPATSCIPLPKRAESYLLVKTRTFRRFSERFDEEVERRVEMVVKALEKLSHSRRYS